MKRHILFLCIPVTLFISACAKEDGSQERAATDTLDVSQEAAADAVASPAPVLRNEAADEEAPGISTAAAPNVAFAYRYAFALPDAKVSAVQNEHADACETLGSARCQVTDMQFSKSDEGVTNAALSFKLDPVIARKFGRDAIASVEKAEGVLANGDITGTNVGGEIEESQNRSSMLKPQLERLEKRLASAGLSGTERSALTKRAEELRQELEQEQNSRSGGEAKLSMTPVQFTYEGNDGVAGFGRYNPFAGAFEVAATSFAAMFSFILMALGFAGPWIALAALIILLMRSRFMAGIRNWLSRGKPAVETPPEK